MGQYVTDIPAMLLRETAWDLIKASKKGKLRLKVAVTGKRHGNVEQIVIHRRHFDHPISF